MKNPRFAERIKRLMFENGLKARDLSKLMGCPEATVNSWRSGVIPAWEKHEKLAQIMGVSPSFLVFGGDESDGPVFCNCAQPQNQNLREGIERHIRGILDEAENCPGALEHMYIEMLLRFPRKMYKNIPAIKGE